MTVAAVILAASPALALADAEGTPAVRRIADAAWAGGAMPIVVVAHDPEGELAAALATAEVTLLEPAPLQGGTVGQLARGIRAAVELVGATSAALVWPAHLVWADAETVTTLIGAHGDDPSSLIRPAYDGEPGWPALLPLSALTRLMEIAPGRMPHEILDDLAAGGLALGLVDTGDPGTTHDIAVARADLPAFDGPPGPDDRVEREWGAAAAAQRDDVQPAGPARLAPADPTR